MCKFFIYIDIYIKNIYKDPEQLGKTLWTQEKIIQKLYKNFKKHEIQLAYKLIAVKKIKLFK